MRGTMVRVKQAIAAFESQWTRFGSDGHSWRMASFSKAGIRPPAERALAISPLHAVVFKWSGAWKRHERQGGQATRAAISRAKKPCHAGQVLA